jgi:hypothetical protein
MRRPLRIAVFAVSAISCVALLLHLHRGPSARTESGSPAPPKPAALERVTAAKLFEAYTAGAASADPVYRGKRVTIIGNVATVRSDAAVPAVVLGSNLEPVIATGIDGNSAASLIPGSAIEVDCTVNGKIVDMPSVDCGPNGVPRPVAPEP